MPAHVHVAAVLLGETGALSATAAGSVIAIHSTVQSWTIQRMADAAPARGVAVIDACVTGGRAVAEERELSLLIGGDESAVDGARPVLEAYGTTPLHAGPRRLSPTRSNSGAPVASLCRRPASWRRTWRGYLSRRGRRPQAGAR